MDLAAMVDWMSVSLELCAVLEASGVGRTISAVGGCDESGLDKREMSLLDVLGSRKMAVDVLLSVENSRRAGTALSLRCSPRPGVWRSKLLPSASLLPLHFLRSFRLQGHGRRYCRG